MMQMNPTIPSSTQNFTNSYQIKPVNFHCSRGGSPLNPTSCSAQSVNGPTEKNRIHLNNLEKLLQKRSQQPTQQPDPIPVQQRGRAGILEGLDVTRFWPDMMTTIASATADHHDKNETASPNCHLNRLQQLLSKTPEYSPRNHISTRWREYHGCNDWAGLLDPLDENLRREVVRYGEFVQAAYHSFHSSPATSTADSSALNSRNNEVALPDRSYKVTKSLYATSSVGLPKWVDEVAPDLGWMTQRSSWIGYVAVCDDQREIARMGRRDIVIALRGTSTCLEWVENVRDVLVPMSPSASSSDNRLPSKVECGFLNLFKTKGEEYCSRDGARNHYIPSLAESVVQEIRRLMETYKGEALSITVTGHSLGAALALLVADEIISGAAAEPASTTPPPPVAVFSFGGPRVGNRAFADRLKSKNVKVLRIVNNQDVITRIPGIFISEELDRRFKNTRMDGILELLDKNLPWAYTHVGTELKVDTKMSPYLKPNADVACCHDLEAYLHLVDGYLAPNCPFRSNAKRSLLKLLTEQGSNVKKLYTSKAKSLTSLKIDRQQHVKDRHHATHQLSTCLPSPS